ncbi:MAG: hypothetical protein L3J53_09120 [Proteobacteria bacterium]|nr:hypothetical protein [Pseudomonadota bacterium]
MEPMTVRYFLLFAFLFLNACNMLPKREEPPAPAKYSSIDAKINPQNQQRSVIETVPLMNEAVKSLYNLAQQNYQQNHLKKAIAQLQRAYRIQANSPEVTQLIAEINLHQGEAKQAHYWATISTQNSPAKGKICEKSWRILALAAELLGDSANQAKALEKTEQCLVKAAPRF